eukprot:970729-Amphidinium_carterae.2
MKQVFIPTWDRAGVSVHYTKRSISEHPRFYERYLKHLPGLRLLTLARSLSSLLGPCLGTTATAPEVPQR